MSTLRWGVACAAAVLVGGCGDTGAGDPALRSAVLNAMADRVTAYKKRDAPAFCRRTVPSTSVPRPLARRLGLLFQSSGPQVGIDEAYRVCGQRFGKHGEWGQPTPDFKMAVTVDPPMSPVGGIDRTATAELKVRGKLRSLRVVFVRHRGVWKMVFEDD